MSNTPISDKHSLDSQVTAKNKTEWPSKEVSLWAAADDSVEATAQTASESSSDELYPLTDVVVMEESKGVVLWSDEPLPSVERGPVLEDVEHSHATVARLIQGNSKDMVLWNGHEPTTLSLSTSQRTDDSLADEILEIEPIIPERPEPVSLLGFTSLKDGQQFGEKASGRDEEERVIDLSDDFASFAQEKQPKLRAVESPEYVETAEDLPEVFQGETLTNREPVLTTIPAEESRPVKKARAAALKLTPEPSPNAVDVQGHNVQVARLSSFWLFASSLLFIGFIIFSNIEFSPAQSLPENSAEVNKPSRPYHPVSNAATNTSAGSEQTSDASLASAQPGDDAPSEATNSVKPDASVPPAEIEATKAPVAAPAIAEASATESTTTDNKPAPASSTPQDGSFTTQVSSSQNIADSTKRAEDLKAAGFQARVVKVDVPKRGTWYRVQVGFFSSRKEAEVFAAQMKSQGAATDVIITPTEAQ